MGKQSEKHTLIQQYATQYKVTCVGYFHNYATTEKCEFCPKPLEKAYYYFRCIKKCKEKDEQFVTFFTGPKCGKDLATACGIKKLPALFSLFIGDDGDEDGTKSIAPSEEAASAIHPLTQKALLDINRQFLNALETFVALKKKKPSDYIAELMYKTREYGTTQAAFPSQITNLSKFIAEDFNGQTLTARLAILARQHPNKRLKNPDFALLRQACEEQNVQSYY